jgi:hypothetical protein
MCHVSFFSVWHADRAPERGFAWAVVAYFFRQGMGLAKKKRFVC